MRDIPMCWRIADVSHFMLEQITETNLLSFIPKREAGILRCRLGIGVKAPMTLEKTGKRFHISRERTRQLEERSLARLSRILQRGANR